MNTIVRWIGCAVLLAACAFGQSKPEEAHARYRLNFVLKQLDQGKVLSTHNYTTYAETSSGAAQIRTGNRVPVDVGGEKGIQYVDVGFNCDARIDGPTNGSGLGFDITWDLSTMPAVTGSEKIIRQVRVRSTPNLPLGKQALVGSADDINSGQQFELWVTVTPEG
jgi:hypothetical protein